MVFQASVLPAIGIILTPWNLSTEAIIAALLGLVSAAYILLRLRSDRILHFGDLMGMGFLYFAYAAYVITIPM
jgi:cation:H+ antiporter